MINKILIICSFILILVFGFMYTQESGLFADDKNKKDCSSSCTQKTGTSSADNKSGCTEKSMSGSAISDDKVYATYEFVTDKIHCDDCKTEMSGNLMGIAGVKEINYGETCAASKMTSVKVFYSSEETTPEVIAASVKEKGLRGNCEDGSKCGSKKTTEKKL